MDVNENPRASPHIAPPLSFVLLLPRHIFTPHASSLRPSSPLFVAYATLFQQRWAVREPVVVRGCAGDRRLWSPEVRGGHRESDAARRMTWHHYSPTSSAVACGPQ